MDLSNENIIHFKKNGIEYIQFKKLLEYKHVINHAYSLGTNVNYMTEKADKQPLEQSKYDKIIENYKDLCDIIGSDYTHLVKANQEHTDQVKFAKQKIKLNEPDIHVQDYNKTDGLITNKNELLLCTTNADCILLLFFDPLKKVIANTHSGWRGTIQRISVKTVRKMKEEYNCNPKDIICCICPSIRKCHFEVDKEVKKLFEKEFQEINKIIEESILNKKWNIDTVEINKKLLQKEGLQPENIIDSKICSMCHSDLIHSYRVEKENYGLNTALIELR